MKNISQPGLPSQKSSLALSQNESFMPEEHPIPNEIRESGVRVCTNSAVKMVTMKLTGERVDCHTRLVEQKRPDSSHANMLKDGKCGQQKETP